MVSKKEKSPFILIVFICKGKKLRRLMSIFSLMKVVAGSAGGVFVYMTAKLAAGISNIKIRKQGLGSETIEIMKPLFPFLDLARIRIKPRSTIPANWLKRRAEYVAMTFGYTIYYAGTSPESTNEGLNILMHELVHADQVRKRGDSEARFASDYGIGFLNAGNYRNNPLEEEAFDFVRFHQLPES